MESAVKMFGLEMNQSKINDDIQNIHELQFKNSPTMMKKIVQAYGSGNPPHCIGQL
jgi:hypothetical protein